MRRSTTRNFSRAKAIWSGECAALIWTRMRALPTGTTGSGPPAEGRRDVLPQKIMVADKLPVKDDGEGAIGG